jgi:hypothetical protein
VFKMDKPMHTIWLREGSTVYCLQDGTLRGKLIQENRFSFSVQGHRNTTEQEREEIANCAMVALNSYEAMKEALEIMSAQYKLFVHPETDALAAFTITKADAALTLANGEC